jgi:protein subunit release factor A
MTMTMTMTMTMEDNAKERAEAAPGPADASDAADSRLLAQCDVETFRASGPGGQHRNRRESGVRLRHRPTGIVVTATERRSQHQNRAVALDRLRAKLAARRKKRKKRVATRPSKAAKRRRLESKKHTARKKRGRARPGGGEEG